MPFFAMRSTLGVGMRVALALTPGFTPSEDAE